MAQERFRSSDNTLDKKCEALLERLASQVEGKTLLYATRYVRTDEKRKVRRVPGVGGIASVVVGTAASAAFDIAMKSASHTLGSGLPKEGWFFATDDGISIFSLARMSGKVGSFKGHVPNELIQGVSVERNRRTGSSAIELTLFDESRVQLQTKTIETYPALIRWVKGVPEAEQPVVEEVLFDAGALYENMPGQH